MSSDAEQSLVAPRRGPTIARVLGVALGVGLIGAAAWWMLGRGGKGEPDDPGRVLIVTPSPELSPWLQELGFDAVGLGLGEAIGEGQQFDGSLDGLAAVLELADQRGYGFVALDLVPGHRYAAELERLGFDPAIPADASFAVISVGDIAGDLTFAGPVAAIQHEPPAREQVGLLFALFEQPELDKVEQRSATNELMIRFDGARTIEDLREYEDAQRAMQRDIEAWTDIARRERGEPPPTELASAYEQVLAWPLASGELLLATRAGALRSRDGRRREFDSNPRAARFELLTGIDPQQRTICTELPDVFDLDKSFVVAPAGDAIMIPTEWGVAELWARSGEQGCGFEALGELRRLWDGEPGKPRAQGRTAEILHGQLAWADLRQARFRGFGPPTGLTLLDRSAQWVADDLLIARGTLDRAAMLTASVASEEPLAGVASEPPPSVESVPRDALVWFGLPAQKSEAPPELAILTIDRISGSESTALLDVFVVAGDPRRLILHIDDDSGARLVELISSASPSELVHEVGESPRPDALELPADAFTVRPLATLPADAFELSVAPTGAQAAWIQRFGEAPIEQPERASEVVLLSLAQPNATPRRMTDNDRADLTPRFAGPGGGWIVFESSYRGAQDLPILQAARVLPID